MLRFFHKRSHRLRMLSSWVEHDPQEVLDTITHCIAGALKTAKESVGKVKVVAVGLTNQRETTLAWDKKTGKPLHNAIVWLDGRTAGICARYKEQLGSSVSSSCTCKFGQAI